MSKLSKCRCSSTCDQSHSNELRTSFSNTLFQQSHSGVTPLQFAISPSSQPRNVQSLSGTTLQGQSGRAELLAQYLEPQLTSSAHGQETP